MVLLVRSRMSALQRHEAIVELTTRARAILRLEDEAVVSIREHDCGEAGCAGTRTVILILRAYHPTQGVKIDKPLEAVTRDDLVRALAPLARRIKSAKPVRRPHRLSAKARSSLPS